MKSNSEPIQIPYRVYLNLVNCLTVHAPTDTRAKTCLEQLTDIAISTDEPKTETNTDIEIDNVSPPTDIYQFLRSRLERNEWKQADSATKYLIEKKGDLKIIDELWMRYSNGRFGFSVQSKIWERLAGGEYPSAEDCSPCLATEGDVIDPYKHIEWAFNVFVSRVGWNNNHVDLNNTFKIPLGYYPKSYVCGGNDLKLCEHLTFIIKMHKEEKRRSLLADPNGVKKYGSSIYSTGQKVRFLIKGSKYYGRW